MSAFHPLQSLGSDATLVHVLASLILLVTVGSSASPFDANQRVTLQEAVKGVVQCGLGPVSTRYDADLEEDLLIVTAVKTATNEQLACADKAVGYYTLQLPPNIQPRYEAIREVRWSGAFREDARSWLVARGLLNQIPPYREGLTDDAAFTRQVESLCGPRAKGAFQSKFGFHALSPEWIKREMRAPNTDTDAFSCLMNVTMVAGFKVGFIGNESYER